MIEQIAIAFTGAVAIFLTQDRRERVRKWACLFGICGQPFWIYATWKGGQWGMLALTFLYTAAWAKGVWTHWIAPYVRAEVRSEGDPAEWENLN